MKLILGIIIAVFTIRFITTALKVALGSFKVMFTLLIKIPIGFSVGLFYSIMYALFGAFVFFVFMLIKTIMNRKGRIDG